MRKLAIETTLALDKKKRLIDSQYSFIFLIQILNKSIKMGAWGTKVFEDDHSTEWYDEFCEGDQSFETFENAFENVNGTESEVDYEFCTAALVSAEIIAATIGKPSEDFPDEEYHTYEDDTKLAAVKLELFKKDITSEIIANAKKAVKRVRKSSDSELRQLWVGSDDFALWEENLSKLEERLS